MRPSARLLTALLSLCIPAGEARPAEAAFSPFTAFESICIAAHGDPAKAKNAAEAQGFHAEPGKADTFVLSRGGAVMTIKLDVSQMKAAKDLGDIQVQGCTLTVTGLEDIGLLDFARSVGFSGVAHFPTPWTSFVIETATERYEVAGNMAFLKAPAMRSDQLRLMSFQAIGEGGSKMYYGVVRSAGGEIPKPPAVSVPTVAQAGPSESFALFKTMCVATRANASRVRQVATNAGFVRTSETPESWRQRERNLMLTMVNNPQGDEEARVCGVFMGADTDADRAAVKEFIGVDLPQVGGHLSRSAIEEPNGRLRMLAANDREGIRRAIQDRSLRTVGVMRTAPGLLISYSLTAKTGF